MLEDAGMGASLQHYNPLVDDEVRAAWNLPLHWKLIAQMPFGVPVTRPGSKEVMPLDLSLIHILLLLGQVLQ